MAKAFAIVIPSGRNFYVKGLQDHRPLGAFSFLGRYRLIDFALSNLTNSEIDRIQVYVGQNPRSLAEHLGNGANFNINLKHGKLQLLFNQDSKLNDIYNTDIAAFASNLSIIQRMLQEYVVITPSYMIFRQNFEDLLNKHIDSGADITVLYHKVDNAKEQYRNMTLMSINRQKGVTNFFANLGKTDSANLSMGTYIMKRDLLVELIQQARKTSSIYRLVDIINDRINDLDVRAVQHRGYFAAIYDLKSYMDANFSLLDYNNVQDLFVPEWPFYTVTTDACPAHYFPGSSVRGSMVANGCDVEGSIENSVIGRNVKICKGAVVKNCVVLSHSVIGRDVHLENQVVDKWAKIINAKEIVASPDNPGYIEREDTL
jgi:glucose-1-phosphate adenylyltransferase